MHLKLLTVLFLILSLKTFSQSRDSYLDYINVQAYTGTPNGTRDESKQISAAVTAAIASGRILYFPSGVYKLDSTTSGNDIIPISTGTQLRLKFDPGAILLTSSKTATMFDIFAGLTSIEIDGGYFKSNHDTTNIGNACFLFQGKNPGIIRHVKIHGCTFEGFSTSIVGKGVQDFQLYDNTFLAPAGHDNATTTTIPAVFIEAVDDSVGDENKNWNIYGNHFDGFSGSGSVTSLKTGGPLDGAFYGHVSGLMFHDNSSKHFVQEHILYQPGITFIDSIPSKIYHNQLDCSIPTGSKTPLGVSITSVVGIRAEGQFLSITDNDISQATVGIQSYATSSWNFIFHNIVISNNRIKINQNSSNAPTKGIQVQGYSSTNRSKGAVITDNTIIIDSVTLAQTLFALTANFYDSSVIANNTILESRVTKSGGGVRGINANTDTLLVLRNNILKNVDTASFFQSSTIDSGSASGSALPTGISPLYLQALNSTTYQFGDPRQLDTLYMVDDGQSNDFGNADTTGLGVGDTASDYRVLVADTVTGGFKIAQCHQYPFNIISGTGTTYSLSHSFYFARKYARMYGKYVKLIHNGHNGQLIASWYNAGASQILLDSLVNRITRFGFPRIDVFVWDQGESDASTTASVYNAAWDSVKANLRRRTVMNFTTKILCVGMPQIANGAPSGYQGQDANIQTRDYNWDLMDSYVNTDSGYVNSASANQVHFSNIGLKKIGENAMWNAWLATPSLYYTRNNPGTLQNAPINPGRITVRYSEVAAGGSYYDGVNIMNRISTGRTGVHVLSSDSTSTVGYLGLAGPSASYLQANSFILGTESNSNIEIDRNFTVQSRFTSVGDSLYVPLIYAPTGGQAIKLTGTSATGGEAIQYAGPGGSDFGNVGMNNSSATTFPGWFMFYHSNYWLWHNDNGTVIGNGPSTGFPTAARATLDVNGSLALKVDSFTATASLLSTNCHAWFKTGSTTDTAFLPGSTAKANVGYFVMKTDNGVGGVVLYDGTSGHTINGAASLTLSNQYDAVYIQYNGNGSWFAKVFPSSSAGTNYQTVQSTGTSQTQRGRLNFSSLFSTTDNSGNNSTDIGLASIAAHSYLGNNTASAAVPSAITNTQLTADLNQFTSSLQGLVPSSGGGTTNFLRADGTWAAPSGGSGVTTVGTFSGSSQTNGASISTSTITFGPADGTNPGMVTIGTQTFAGTKTFSSAPVLTTSSTTGAIWQATNTSGAGGWGIVMSGTNYIPSVGGSSNLGSISLTHAYYTRNGNIIHVSVTGSYTYTSGGASTISIALPLTGSTNTNEFIGQGAQVTVGGTQTDGWVIMGSSTSATFNFTESSGSATSNFIVSFDYSL